MNFYSKLSLGAFARVLAISTVASLAGCTTPYVPPVNSAPVKAAPVAAPMVAAPSISTVEKESLSKTIENLDVDHLKIAEPEDDGPRPFGEDRPAMADVDATLFAARQLEKQALIVMGANWCHDSRALAGHFQKPRFQTLFAKSFELVYVDTGLKGGDTNNDVAQRFGLPAIKGTPTVFIIDKAGKALNLDSATAWRNSAERTEDAVYDELVSYLPKDTEPKE